MSWVELGLGQNVLYQAFIRRQHLADTARASGYPGPHVSGVIQGILRRTSKPRASIPRPIRVALFELGTIIESVVAEELRRQLGWEKPEPRKVDGLWCSPDGFDVRTRTIDEVKATFCSSREGIAHPAFWKFDVQALAYHHVWQARRIRLHVLFLRGNYADQPFPDPHTFVRRPSAEESAAIWANLLSEAREMRMIP